MQSKFTLAKRFLFYIIPVALGGISVLGTTAYFISRKHILNNVDKEIHALAEQVSLSLSSFFKQRSNDLETISENPLLADYYNNRDFQLMREAEIYLKEIGHYFLKFSKRTGGLYHRIIYVDEQGMEVCKVESSVLVLNQKPFKESGILQQVRRLSRFDHYESSITTDPRLGPVVWYAKPILNSEETFKGAIVIECNLKPVEETLARANIGPSGWAYLSDQSNYFLIGKGPPSSVQPKQFLTIREVIPGSRWSVVIGADMRDFLKPLRQIQYLTILLGFVCGTVVAFLIYFRVKNLTHPIHKLVEAAKRLETGDLSGRVTLMGTDEVGALSKAFNNMAQSLEERTSDLESRIDQLTALRKMEESVIQRQDEETILRSCLEAVAQGFGFDRTGLYWIDYEKREIAGRYVYGVNQTGFSESSFRKRRISLGENDILNQLIETRSAVLVNELTEDPRLNQKFINETKTKEFVAAPICGKNKVFGILAADNYYSGSELKESDKEGLTVFANAMGMALDNVALVQNLSQSEARNRAVLENSPVAVIGLSREHHINIWNRGAENIFGYSDPEIMGKPINVLFPPESEKDFKDLLSELMHNGSIRDHSIQGITKNGKKLELSLSWGGGHPDFWMNKEWAVVIRDVTESKMLQQQVIHSEKLSAVGKLISCVAHELNNPLQAVIGYAQLLAWKCSESPNSKNSRSLKQPKKMEGFNQENLKESLRLICDNSLRCGKIIDNLLLFVRHGKVEKRLIHVEEAIHASLELLEYKLKKAANIRIDFQPSSFLPPIKADFQQIQQIFINLINNSCDAMGGWTGPKQIRILTSVMNSTLRIEVSDSGPGISAEVQKQLFEPFFTTKPEGRGTGLGLTVCREIVKDHGGEMGFKSRLGEGTTFWIELPADHVPIINKAVEEVLIPPVTGKSILLVDDEPDILSFLLKLAESEGNQADSAESFESAVSKISQKPFDLIVSDIRLGDGTGTELYENWTKWCSYPRPAFLFLTGDVLNTELEQSLGKKGLILLKKPVNLESFQSSMRSLLSNAKKSDSRT